MNLIVERLPFNPAANLDQGKNGPRTSPISPMEWVNGNLNSSGAHYVEGYSIPYRAILTDMPASTSVTLTIGFDIKHSDRHAIDYLTSFDNINNPNHVTFYEHTKETIIPTLGFSGMVAGASGPDIPTPTSVNSPVAGQPTASFNAQPAGQKKMSIWNADITNIVYLEQGDLTLAQSEAQVSITFTTFASFNGTVIISWGGHIGTRLDWGEDVDGVPLSAGGISGSPYHMRLKTWTLDNLGNQDRSLSADAIAAPPDCPVYSGPTTICPNTPTQYSVTIDGCTNPVHSWVFVSNTAGASIVGSATGATVMVTTTQCGTFCLKDNVVCSEGSPDPIACQCYTVTVGNADPPTIGDAGANATIECPATPTFTPPTSSDICGSTVQQVGSDVTGGNSCARTVTRTWNAVDGCGNTSATRSQTITIVDLTAPTIGSAGGNATIECTGTPTYTPPTASDACNGATVSQVGSDVTGGNSCVRTVTRTWRAVDGCGNQSVTQSQTITIVDLTAPTIGAAGANATIECPATPTFTPPTANDACNGATVNQVGSDVTGGNSCVRTVTRTWNAVDGCGNTSVTRSQTITIADLTAPTVGTAGANATIECPATPTFTPPTANDACNGATVNQVGSDVTGGNSCVRTVTRTWRAVDGCGNQSVTRSQTITIVDLTAPTIGAAGANATFECPATPTFTPPTASDACNGATVNQVGSDVTGGSVGTNCTRTITRTWNAVDGCGNTSVTRSQTITVIDDQAPTIGTAGANATIECPATPTFTPPTANDACSGATVNQVGSDVTGGNSCSRTVTRTWNAVDLCGNQSVTRSQTITIVDLTAPTIGAAGANATIECPATPTFTPPTANDACNGATVSQVGSDVTGGNSCVRTVTRTWRAVDGCGNQSVTRSQTITIADLTAPTIGSAGSNATIECPATPTFTPPTASDACNGATVNQVGSDVTGGNSCVRTVTRTWRAVDGCGNQSVTRSQTITIADLTAPTIGSAGGNATIECPATPTFTAPTASDACNGATVNQIGSDVTGGNSCARTVTRTWRAVDGCGNQSVTRSQTVTIVDLTAPTIGSAGINATISCTATPTFTAPTASDACNGATVNVVSDVTVAGACGSYTRTRTWRAVDGCGNQSVTRSQTISVDCPCGGNCTYTQGAYGTEGGSMCDGITDGLTTAEAIAQSLANSGGTIRIGKPGHSIVMTSAAPNSTSCIIDVLPGSGTSKELAAGDPNICSLPDSYLKNGRINNTLAGQTIALSLNVALAGNPATSSLGNFVLQGGVLATAAPDGGCTSTTPIARVCVYDPITHILTGVVNQYLFKTIPQSVVDAIVGPKTVNGLLELANNALANTDLVVGFENGVSLDAINQAVSAINEAFDECRVFIGWDVPGCPLTDPSAPFTRMNPGSFTQEFQNLTVNAYPNPFRNKVNFVIASPVSGQATLEIHNMLGQKIQTVYNGYIIAGRNHVVEYKTSEIINQTLIYVFQVGDKKVAGKLVNIQQ